MFSINPQYAYLLLGLALLVVWLLIFWIDKERRTHQFVISTMAGLVSPISELLYIPDYWRPLTIFSLPIGNSYISPEDFLFGFAFVGIMSALPGFVIVGYRESHPVSWGALFKIVLVGLAVFCLTALIWSGGVNSIYASSIAVLAVASVFLLSSRQKDLNILAICGAFGMTALMFIVYWCGAILVSNFEGILKVTWSLYGTPLGTLLLGVPISELVFAFSLGTTSVIFARWRV